MFIPNPAGVFVVQTISLCFVHPCGTKRQQIQTLIFLTCSVSPCSSSPANRCRNWCKTNSWLFPARRILHGSVEQSKDTEPHNVTVPLNSNGCQQPQSNQKLLVLLLAAAFGAVPLFFWSLCTCLFSRRCRLQEQPSSLEMTRRHEGRFSNTRPLLGNKQKMNWSDFRRSRDEDLIGCVVPRVAEPNKNDIAFIAIHSHAVILISSTIIDREQQLLTILNTSFERKATRTKALRLKVSSQQHISAIVNTTEQSTVFKLIVSLGSL